MRRVVIVDISAFAHAAWHGYPESTGADGQCYRVLHGVLSKLHRLERDYAWDSLLAALDPEGGSLYRKSIYPAYKANRPAPEPDFTRQRAHIDEMLREFGIPIAKVHGVESDDVIGTIARREANAGALVMVVTPDKDMAQLVQEGIGMLRPLRMTAPGDPAFEYLTEQGVFDRYGVWPNQIPDWLALIGDTVDNIPGVDKVGPKTAARWLQKYGDMETLLTRSEELSGVAAKNLRDARALLPMVKMLTTIQHDVEVGSLEELASGSQTTHERSEQARMRWGMPDWMGRWMPPSE